MSWLEALKKYAEQHPIAVLRFTLDEWESLTHSRRGVGEFTIAVPHALISGIRTPAPCLLLGNSGGVEQVLFGLISSHSPITTLDSRIKVTRTVVIAPSSVAGLLALISDAPHAKNFSSRVENGQSVTLLSPKLSGYLIDRLATISSNKGGLRAVAEKLSVPKRFKDNTAMQEDAVQTALAAFGLGASDQANTVELAEGRSSALGRVAIMEDSVVEHDARSVPGYSLIKSDVTGRAVFKKGEEQLEVFTANRRDLEHCLGVDLIYVNLTKQSVVMLQYKMLEASGMADSQTDWIYRPDGQLNTEIARMNAFAAAHAPGPKEYRLNPQVFYMKFVKRDALLRNGGIITPLDHFEKVRSDPSFKGPKQGLRLSFKSLSGRYLRQTSFLDLIRCGYIGAHAKTAADLQLLIDAILSGNKAVVAAVQRKVGQ
jgi:hypothetical protein